MLTQLLSPDQMTLQITFLGSALIVLPSCPLPTLPLLQQGPLAMHRLFW